ncbi:MAG: glycoside hydrolase family 95 protein [Candidatus Latescibacteria bacterium]|jgi:alpha-L-fucosidase 2|nr:glycoside hydrolase family 95 protein [Candidatus Latescibacterota bacterium]MBT5831318.1 glycoside hydrolase family 95 protein [Candidatus Latescibacterota bacterium]
MRLWYDKPAEEWNHALPVGSGKLGAMVFGGVSSERIQMNEDSIWAGPPVPEAQAGAKDAVAQARDLLFDGEYAQAQNLVQDRVMGERIAPRSYQPLGDLLIDLEGVKNCENYTRELTLETAIASTEWTANGIGFQRDVFASAVDNTIVCRLEADQEKSLSCRIAFQREENAQWMTISDDTLLITGCAGHGDLHSGVGFAAALKVVVEGGHVQNEDPTFAVQNANAITIFVCVQTDYNFANPSECLTENLSAAVIDGVEKISQKKYTDVRSDHVADHQGYFNRCSFSLGEDTLDHIPTDQRLAVFAEQTDLALLALYFNYGRYLTICDSRPKSLCANLQGVWNQEYEAPWNSDYHININIQMIYWLAELVGLSDCHEPFLEFANALRENARQTALEVYGCRGTVAHHTTDVWRFTVPFGEVQYGMWPMASGWNSRHFMEHYDFTGSESFLRDDAWPVIKDAALFFLDWLTPDPKTGKLVSGPSSSPENRFVAPGTEDVCNLVMGPSMDHQIIWETFTNCLRCTEILGLDDPITQEIQTALDKLAEAQIGADGRLMEWTEEFEEPEPGHRHISHIYGVYPGFQFVDQPDMLAAARKSVEHRLSHGGGHTGWSRAWLINVWARLKDADRAWEDVRQLLIRSTLPNLFDNHPPFQLDGNIGGAAGLVEMLLQSHHNAIELFPALPIAWPEGSVKGLRARGGFVIDLDWNTTKTACIHATLGGICNVRYNGQIQIYDSQGETLLDGHGEVVLETVRGVSYEVALK